MWIKVKVYGAMRDVLGKKGWFELSVEKDITIGKLSEKVGLKKEWFMTVLVNHYAYPLNKQLKEGDIVEFIPKIEGG